MDVSPPPHQPVRSAGFGKFLEKFEKVENIISKKKIDLIFVEIEYYGVIHYSMLDYLNEQSKNYKIIVFTHFDFNMEKTVKLTTTFQSKLTIDFGAN